MIRRASKPRVRGVGLLLLLSVALIPFGDFVRPALADDKGRGVAYLTLRDRTGDDDPGKFYGSERGMLDAGYCDIADRSLDILSGVAEAVPFRIPEEILRLDAVRPMPIGMVLDQADRSSGERGPVIYMHGFFIDFEKGCRRATVLKENAGLEDRFLWFSWPSDGDLLNYTRDEADLYWSVPDLAELIVSMAGQMGPGRVNVMGHSLGGRGIAVAVYDAAARAPGLQLGDVVLLAPDIDFDLFAKILPRIRMVARSITVYQADADRPLALSAQVHGYPRLGQSGNDLGLLDGVEVIDVSDLQVRSASGHLYHIYNDEVGADLDQLLNRGLRAGARANMVQAGPNLWRLQRAGDD